MSSQGFSNMYDQVTDTELEGPTRWENSGTLVESARLLSFNARELRRAFHGFADSIWLSFLDAREKIKYD